MLRVELDSLRRRAPDLRVERWRTFGKERVPMRSPEPHPSLEAAPGFIDVELDSLRRMVVVHATQHVSSADRNRALRFSGLELTLGISCVVERARLGTPEQRLRRVERVHVYAYWPPLATSMPSEDGCDGSWRYRARRERWLRLCPVFVRRRCRFVRRASTAESDVHREDHSFRAQSQV